MAKKTLKDADVESIFASTLVMDGKVSVMERADLAVQSADVMRLFGHWATRNLHAIRSQSDEDWGCGLEETTRYGYLVEEIRHY